MFIRARWTHMGPIWAMWARMGPRVPVWARVGPARAHAVRETISEIYTFPEEKKNSLYEQHLFPPLLHEDLVELSIARKN